MKESKYSDSQIVSILKEAEAGQPVEEISRKHGISSACYYQWKAKFGGLSVSELKRNGGAGGGEREAQAHVCRSCAGEHGAEGSDRKKALRPPEKRAAVEYLVEAHELSIRKVCAAIGISRAAWYRPLVDWLERDRPIAEALSTLAETKPGLGFWKLFRRLRRKRVYRAYCLLKLNLRRRTKKRVPPRDPMPLVVPQQPNQVWSADFMSDALYNGVRFRTFKVLDDFNREVLAIETDTSLPSQRLVRVFEQLKAERGLPDVLRTDNGPERSRRARRADSRRRPATGQSLHF